MGSPTKGLLISAAATPMILGGPRRTMINFEAFERHITDLVDAGHDGIVASGTTGQACTTTHKEDLMLFRRASNIAGDRCRIIAGTGSNCTYTAEENTKAVVRAGAEAVLVLMPYGNKPTREGVRRHYRAVKKAAGEASVIAYCCKSRTGIAIHPEDACLLAEEGTIQEIKLASADRDQEQYIIANAPKELRIYSGDDATAIELSKLGAHGVVSVTSDLAPRMMRRYWNLIRNEDWEAADSEHQRLLPLMEAMFIETNPIPLGTAMSILKPDVYGPIFRMPLCEMSEDNQEKLKKVLASYPSIY